MEFYSYIYKFLFTAITLVVISLVSCIFIFADRMGFERDDCILNSVLVMVAGIFIIIIMNTVTKL